MMLVGESIAAQNINQELTYISSTLKCKLASAPTAASPDPCALEYIGDRGAALFRRPLTTEESNDLYATYLVGVSNPPSATTPTTSGIQLVLSTILEMPEFFYRTELGDPADTTSSPVQLTQYEIASAVSYLANGSPPDATLLAAAAAGSLGGPEAIAAQYQRLIATPSGHGQMEQFVLQWLAEDQLVASGPVTPALASDMANESKSFVEEAVFKESGTLKELLTGEYTFVNTELATFYGLPTTGTTTAVQKLSLDPSSKRLGLLSQGAFLVASSQSPVPLLHRGKIIRNQLFCEALPSGASLGLPNFTPPPFVAPAPPTTTRQALSRNVQGKCLTCHQYFMPLGFGLENFDAAGRYRTTDNGGAIDPSGEIVESTSVDPATGAILAPASSTTKPFSDYAGLAKALADDARVQSCFSSQVLAFASGRGVAMNECAIQDVQKPAAGATVATVQQQFLNYVTSPNFTKRVR
jgi:hypothetical protein